MGQAKAMSNLLRDKSAGGIEVTNGRGVEETEMLGTLLDTTGSAAELISVKTENILRGTLSFACAHHFHYPNKNHSFLLCW
jgi:hypothetical protein